MHVRYSEFQCFIFHSAVTWLSLGSIPAWVAIYFFIFNLFDQLLWIITKSGLSATFNSILIKSFANQIYFILESLLNLFHVLMCVEVNGYQNDSWNNDEWRYVLSLRVVLFVVWLCFVDLNRQLALQRHNHMSLHHTHDTHGCNCWITSNHCLPLQHTSTHTTTICLMNKHTCECVP
jgi:hypothetical protein